VKNDRGCHPIIVITIRSFPLMTYHRVTILPDECHWWIRNCITSSTRVHSRFLVSFLLLNLTSVKCFLDNCVSSCPFCIVCPSSIHRFRLPLWYLRFTDSDYLFGILDSRILITSLVS
jgi:hypothetical protein